MLRAYSDASIGGRLLFETNAIRFGALPYDDNCSELLTIGWNKGTDQEITIDKVKYNWRSGDILTIMTNQSYDIREPQDITYWQFNKDFYCIIDHDKEVSCVGFLFYGWNQVMFIKSSEDLSRKLNLLAQVFEDEYIANDNIQGEMLRMLLKRLIIILTREARSQQTFVETSGSGEFDLIRSFNLSVEQHFKKFHQVQDYANLLHKSPKTLSNVFRKYNVNSPLQIIQERIALEAKRLLIYTDKSVSEISHELGFGEASHFSRFFKKMIKESPKTFKESFLAA